MCAVMAIITMTALEAELWAPSVTPTMMEWIGSTSRKTKTKRCGSDEWICGLNSWPAPLDPECRGDGLGSGFKKDLERRVEALYTRNSHLFPLVSGENRCECASGREAGRHVASADSHIVLQ